MKLKNLGKVYTLDSDNNFDLQKDITLSEDVMVFVNIILNYFLEVVCIDIHSAYLRGSCLERNVVDSDTMDIDMIIVCENDLPHKSFEYKNEIIKIMKSSCEFSVDPDVRIVPIDDFLKSPQARFLSKKVYGKKDLSLSKRSKSEMIDWIDKNYDGWISRVIQDIREDKKTLNHDLIRSDIKLFFRDFSIKLMIENDEFSTSLNKCHRVMVENYPYYSDDLNDILNLFLNIEEYSKEKIIADLNKIILFVRSIQSKKLYRIKINRKRQ